MKTCLVTLFMLLASSSFAQPGVPEIPFDSVPDFLKLPAGMNFGEVAGVAVNSKGHVFVFTRSNSASGPAYAPTAAQLLEFGAKGEFLREIGKGLYGWSFAHSVRIDKDDNIWAIDKGSDMIIKFNAGRPGDHGLRPAGRNRRTTKPSRGRMSTLRSRRSTDSSASPPTSPGTPRATSTSPTATSTRAWPSTTRTATG